MQHDALTHLSEEELDALLTELDTRLDAEAFKLLALVTQRLAALREDYYDKDGKKR